MFHLLSGLLTEIVTLSVGSERVPLAVHKPLIVADSLFFKRAFGGGFKEAESGTMELPEDDVEAVQTYIAMIYYRFGTKMSFGYQFWDTPSMKPKPVSDQWLTLPTHVYIFAQKVGNSKLMTYTLGSLADAFDKDALAHQRKISPEAVELAFTYLQPGDRLRQLFTDAFVFNEWALDTTAPGIDYNSEFLAGVIQLTTIRLRHPRTMSSWGRYKFEEAWSTIDRMLKPVSYCSWVFKGNKDVIVHTKKDHFMLEPYLERIYLETYVH
jgi:hypothetical protein